MDQSEMLIGNESNVETLVNLIKEQTKEIKINKKKLEKLEEKFVKTNTDLKNIIKDKSNIENFFKTIFSKEMHENIIKTEYGLYDTGDLNKLWLINEQKNQNEFHRILNQCRNENNELNDKVKQLSKELDNKVNEFDNFKKLQMSNNDQLKYYMSNHDELTKKLDSLESEKKYLLSILSQKEEDIRKLNDLELELAELKAKNLLDDIVGKDEIKIINTPIIQIQDKIKITSLNVGCQTHENVYNSEHVLNLDKQIIELKQKYEKARKDFNDYKDKSHRIIIANEDNYNKVLQENEILKKELGELSQALKLKEKEKKNDCALNHMNSFPNLNITDGQKINIEYLKNVLIKYLEAIAIGNEFQIKILENVIFTILNVSKNEKNRLEEKRTRSSFYYNLWYNAKSFLAAKIYGGETDDNNVRMNDLIRTDEEINKNEI